MNPGVYIYSRTRSCADDPGLPVGGAVIDELVDDDGQIKYLVIGIHRGRPVYAWIAAADAAPGSSGDVVRVDVLKDLLLLLGRDQERHQDPLKHHQAFTVLGGILARHSVRRPA